MDINKIVEKILREYDANDNYEEYYTEIFEVYFEPNLFDVERYGDKK